MKKKSVPPIFIILPILIIMILGMIITLSNSNPSPQTVEVVIPNERFKNK